MVASFHVESTQKMVIWVLGFDEDDNGDEVQHTEDDNVRTNGEAIQETEIGLEVPTNA